MNLLPAILISSSLYIVSSRDFYVGMFKNNDLLVAQDNVYKPGSRYGYVTASYGRYFNCPITYFRVVDRLGVGGGPYTTVVRGGLQKQYIVVRIKSSRKMPVSVNIYVGCENKPKKPTAVTTKRTKRTTTKTKPKTTTKTTPKTNSTTTTEAKTTEAINETSTQNMTIATYNTTITTETTITTTKEPEKKP